MKLKAQAIISLCVLTCLGCVSLLVFAFAWSPDNESGGSGSRLLWLAFMGRTFAFHITLASGVAAAVGVLLAARMRGGRANRGRVHERGETGAVAVQWNDDSRDVLSRSGEKKVSLGAGVGGAAGLDRGRDVASSSGGGLAAPGCGRRSRAMLSVAAVVMLGALVANVVLAWRDIRLLGGRTPSAGASRGDVLRVMSMNLLYTDYSVKRTAKVLRAIEEADPDIVLFQEYHVGWDGRLRDAMLATYPFAVRPLVPGLFGQAVYSKRAFVGDAVLRRLTKDDYCPQIGVRVMVGERELEVWNMHLVSPGDAGDIARQWKQIREIRAAIEKVGEWEKAGERIESPLVMAGDFNSTPTSWNADALRALGLREAHETAGAGRGASWPDVSVLRFVPGVRIDQAWGRGVEWVGSRVSTIRTGSDHRAMVYEVRVD